MSLKTRESISRTNHILRGHRVKPTTTVLYPVSVGRLTISELDVKGFPIYNLIFLFLLVADRSQEELSQMENEENKERKTIHKSIGKLHPPHRCCHIIRIRNKDTAIDKTIRNTGGL